MADPTNPDNAIINIQDAIAKGLEMVEAPNIDECSPWQTTAWQKASDFKILTVDSHPQEPLNKGDLMVFLNRLNLFNGGE